MYEIPNAPTVAGLSPVMDETKPCSKCQEYLPKTASYFDRDNHAADGFRDICKQCRAENKQLEENKEIAERVDRLDEATAKVLDIILSDNYTPLPHVGEVYQSLIGVFGGAQGYAQHFMANYLMAKPGSSTRQKQLDTILRMSMKATELGAAKKPLEMMTEEELEKLAKEQIKRLAVYTPEDQDVPATKVS